ncbi:MAG: hypothetical protein JF586_24015 [Burkholderiales bacterium]|nr:hypothetical protein [Burkholderiales bacterium]
MKPKRLTAAQRRLALAPPDFSMHGVGLTPDQYGGAVRYLFDRTVPAARGQEWYWQLDEPEFDATPLEWTRIQTVLFANAAVDLAPFSDDQVGMGLNYLMDNGLSDVPYAAVDASVPLDEAMRMMQAMPSLWRDGIGPRLARVHEPIGSAPSRLGFVCHMWFDVWQTFWRVRSEPRWQAAVWQVLREMLCVPCREVQAAALHGIGHELSHLDRRDEIEKTVAAFIRSIDSGDPDLKNYAEAARQGRVL